MKIYSMTATFGKLAHETLTLQPGLNVIEAPNEWGKSTWCAFLVAMFYGIETRVRSTTAALADKERYAPWSGSPMSGRVDLNWNGRDITIERRTKGRSVFAEFKAYETASGLPVPELTAANCGLTLLGVEKSVFTRAGFLRLTDLPVTQDEALRRRLNALVTTGDESGTADALAQKLKDLKNRCRFNRSGLLPQAEAQKMQLESKLRELDSLSLQASQIKIRQSELELRISQLKNHLVWLRYTAAQEDAQRVSQALAARDNTARQLALLEQECASLPSRDQAAQALHQLQELNQQLLAVQEELASLPLPPEAPVPPAVFQGMAPGTAEEKVRQDEKQYNTLKKAAKANLGLIPAILSLIAGIALFILELPYPAIACLAVFAASAVAAFLNRRRIQRQIQALESFYGSADPADWYEASRDYTHAQQAYEAGQAQYQARKDQLSFRQAELKDQLLRMTQGQSIHQFQQYWHRTEETWEALEDAQREYRLASQHAQTLEAMVKPVSAPQFSDSLRYTEAETARLLAACQDEQRQLQHRYGQCQGQMDSLGSREQLAQQLDAVSARIRKLEDTYQALVLAQNTLAAATNALQRRFAPRIAGRAQALFSQLTGSRYDRLTLGEDLSLHAGAQGEDTLHSSLWRSDGTVDQLYLALRLAVAEELTPDAPLILDDALVRFDDTRLKAALEILAQMAQDKQILLFTCQAREKALMP